MNAYNDMRDDQDGTAKLAEAIDWDSVGILALDLGAVCGFAIGSYGCVMSSSWHLRPNRYDARLQAFKLVEHLEELRRAGRITRVVYHSSRRRNAGRKAAKRAAESLVIAVEKWATDNRLPCEAANRGAVRKTFTGNGNASAGALIDECERRNFMPLGEPDANAFATFDWALLDHIATASKAAVAN